MKFILPPVASPVNMQHLTVPAHMQESMHHMQRAANSIRRLWRKWIAGILGHAVCNPLNKNVCVCAWLLPAVSPIISASRMFSRHICFLLSVPWTVTVTVSSL